MKNFSEFPEPEPEKTKRKQKKKAEPLEHKSFSKFPEEVE